MGNAVVHYLTHRDVIALYNTNRFSRTFVVIEVLGDGGMTEYAMCSTSLEDRLMCYIDLCMYNIFCRQLQSMNRRNDRSHYDIYDRIFDYCLGSGGDDFFKKAWDMSIYTHAIECDSDTKDTLTCPNYSRRIPGLVQEAVRFNRPEAVRYLLRSITKGDLLDDCLTVGLIASSCYKNKPAIEFFAEWIETVTPEHLNVFIAMGDYQSYDKYSSRGSPSLIDRMVTTISNLFIRRDVTIPRTESYL